MNLLLHKCERLGAFEISLSEGLWIVKHTIESVADIVGACADYSTAFAMGKQALQRVRYLQESSEQRGIKLRKL